MRQYNRHHNHLYHLDADNGLKINKDDQSHKQMFMETDWMVKNKFNLYKQIEEQLTF